MTASYRVVQWNSHKRIYDLLLAGGIVLYLVLFILISKITHPGEQAISDEILIIRATGTLAFIMLHIILCIGPAARLDRRFLPLLYNRRHMGVAMFAIAALHALLTIGYYHGFGVIDPLTSLLTSNTNYTSLHAFPFETLGLIALIILFLMAATSHDFWLANLTAGVWKTLHMLVYVAWALLVMHVVLGALQYEKSAIYPGLVLFGITLVSALHGVAAMRERSGSSVKAGPWVEVCGVDEIPEDRARIVRITGRERIAVFRYDGKVSAVSNVCAHQAGPLGEGKIVGGCITCPWHGYQYRPHDGQSPPPYTEKISTFAVRIDRGRVMVDPAPLPPGTPVSPAMIQETKP